MIFCDDLAFDQAPVHDSHYVIPVNFTNCSLRNTIFPILFLVSLLDRSHIRCGLVEIGLVQILVEVPFFENGPLYVGACDLLSNIVKLPSDSLKHITTSYTIVYMVLFLQIMNEIIRFAIELKVNTKYHVEYLTYNYLIDIFVLIV